MQVHAISARLLALRKLLGTHEDIDIIWMVERAPRLLTADLAPMAQQLLNLRVCLALLNVCLLEVCWRLSLH